ncbi:MAG TPA: hypothetical protein ENI23_08965 [bacterium]|nr:hypothetical protein [bacterium]
MIQRIILKDVTIDEFERKFSRKSSGKILTIKTELEPGIDLTIVTSLGEEILTVKESGTYYPRQNISSRKDSTNELTGEVQESDYFYFTDELLIELNSEGEVGGKLAMKELVILYDDMGS